MNGPRKESQFQGHMGDGQGSADIEALRGHCGRARQTRRLVRALLRLPGGQIRGDLRGPLVRGLSPKKLPGK